MTSKQKLETLIDILTRNVGYIGQQNQILAKENERLRTLLNELEMEAEK